MSFLAEPFVRLTVDLDAVAGNYLFLRKKLQPGVDCSAVVKADAYGLGAPVISKALFDQGCRHFFVAQADEGNDVRQALPAHGVPGQQAEIYLLNGICGEDPAELAQAGLTPVLNSFEDVEQLAVFAQKKEKKTPAVLHLDTGINRLGLSGSELDRLAARPGYLDALNIRYVMSHLACADNASHPMNGEQLNLFRDYSARLGRPFRYSFANSCGIFLGPEYHFDLVRPGRALYGITPKPGEISPVQPAVTIEARILQLREIDRAGTIGYAATYPVDSGQKYAIVAMGYADGYKRKIMQGGRVFIQGQSCPLVGRVSMDSINVDVSGLKNPPKPGDWVEIMGEHQTIDDLAEWAGTIGHDILTGIGKRVKRIYRRQGA